MSSVELVAERLPEPDEEATGTVAARAKEVLRPVGALARLDELAVWLAGWQRTARPSVERPAVVLFAGDHGVVSEGVSAYPPEVTSSMVAALRGGVATASVMSRLAGASLEVIDVGVGRPTGNIRTEPALGTEELEEALSTGRRAVAGLDTDLLVLGEMGIGNTTAAAALSHSLFGGDASDWVGPGTGLGSTAVSRKEEVVADAVHRVGDASPKEKLRHLGGWELAAIAAAAAEARLRSIPVLLDGYVVTSAVMTLELARPGALDHCWPGHLSPEPGHRRLLRILGRRPVLDLEMRLGEGSGAIAALPIVRMAAASVTDVATFGEWGLETAQ